MSIRLKKDSFWYLPSILNSIFELNLALVHFGWFFNPLNTLLCLLKNTITFIRAQKGTIPTRLNGATRVGRRIESLEYQMHNSALKFDYFLSIFFIYEYFVSIVSVTVKKKNSFLIVLRSKWRHRLWKKKDYLWVDFFCHEVKFKYPSIRSFRPSWKLYLLIWEKNPISRTPYVRIQFFIKLYARRLQLHEPGMSFY